LFSHHDGAVDFDIIIRGAMEINICVEINPAKMKSRSMNLTTLHAILLVLLILSRTTALYAPTSTQKSSSAQHIIYSFEVSASHRIAAAKDGEIND
jgi:hypothetical protein